MPLAYIGIGSNLNKPLQQVTDAFDALNNTPGIRTLKQSPLYRSKAIGPGQQPDYINAVASIETQLPPQELLRALQQIEHQQGRTRGPIRWVARTIDLDLLLYDNQVINSETLQVPHPRLHERNFVLLPLQDINPDIQLPSGETLANLITMCPSSPIEKLG